MLMRCCLFQLCCVVILNFKSLDETHLSLLCPSISVVVTTQIIQRQSNQLLQFRERALLLIAFEQSEQILKEWTTCFELLLIHEINCELIEKLGHINQILLGVDKVRCSLPLNSDDLLYDAQCLVIVAVLYHIPLFDLQLNYHLLLGNFSLHLFQFLLVRRLLKINLLLSL